MKSLILFHKQYRMPNFFDDAALIYYIVVMLNDILVST